MKKSVKRFSTLGELHLAIASFLEKHSKTILAKNENYNIALSGGRTPAGLFLLLSSEKYRQAIEWERIRIFWSDERYVPTDDAASNYLMAYENLLSHVPVLARHVFRAPTEEITCETAALRYQQMLLEAFSHQNVGLPAADFYPRFDLIMLGMGNDGHTASLFPNHRALTDSNLIAAVDSDYAKPPVPRLTFTLPLINSADTVVFMVSGKDKVNLIDSFINTEDESGLVPASMVFPKKELIWFIVE